MTQRAAREKPTTSWAGRTPADRQAWAGRLSPHAYKAPLQDAYRIVHDQDDKVIYILSNTGTEIPGTFWKTRPLIH